MTKKSRRGLGNLTITQLAAEVYLEEKGKRKITEGQLASLITFKCIQKYGLLPDPIGIREIISRRGNIRNLLLKKGEVLIPKRKGNRILQQWIATPSITDKGHVFKEAEFRDKIERSHEKVKQKQITAFNAQVIAKGLDQLYINYVNNPNKALTN